MIVQNGAHDKINVYKEALDHQPSVFFFFLFHNRLTLNPHNP